ncbi:hypothetical protein OS493_035180 [Desmophyllum pertusum]|uniref:Uncharacterized protein n=1 Tax=Desmophyllum pertusum TaxID=174260 RepID=A0A9W9Y7T7_9CNID|nr:hypothetical protein OS493_035180 [Desmophyllum pertusum]
MSTVQFSKLSTEAIHQYSPQYLSAVVRVTRFQAPGKISSERGYRPAPEEKPLQCLVPGDVNVVPARKWLQLIGKTIAVKDNIPVIRGTHDEWFPDARRLDVPGSRCNCGVADI